MKKIASILVLVFAFTFVANAQKKEKRKEKRPKLSLEQQTNLAIKKMTLELDLTESQQKRITPLFKAEAAKKMAAMKKRKEARKNKERPTADEIYEMKNKHLDNQIAFKNKMKNILNKEQFEKFERMKKGRKMKGKKRMEMKKKKMMMMKKRKEIKEQENR